MIALTMPEQVNGPRPVPWRRMAWLAWRRHRFTLGGAVALFGVLAVYLLITGLDMHSAHAAVAACQPANSEPCKQVANVFAQRYAQRAAITVGLLQVVPALIGAFAGAPILARELESGTFRYTWTQGFGRARWAAAMLAPAAVVVTVAAGAFSLLFSWWYQQLNGASDLGPLSATMFDLRWFVLAAWTLVAFALGALAGMLIRRVVPAIVATLAAYAGLAFAIGAYLRAHYETPLLTSNPYVGDQDLVINWWWVRGGQSVDMATINEALQPVHVQEIAPGLFRPNGLIPDNFDPMTYLYQHGFTQLTTYQPASRFWAFQWIEGGWLLALSLLLIGATVWLVRRRAV